MSHRRFTSNIAVFLGILTGLALVMVVGVYVYLPRWIESSLIPKLAHNAGITDFSLDVRAVDIDGAELAGLRIGPPQEPAILVRSITIDYTLKDLIHKQLARVQMSGIELHCEFKKGRFVFQGLNRLSFPDRLSPQPEPKTTQDVLLSDIPLKKLTIRDAVFICNTATRTFRFPFEIDVIFPGRHAGNIDCSARLYIRGQLLEATGSLYPKNQSARLNVAVRGFDLASLTDVFQAIPDLGIFGNADLQGAFEFDLATFSLASASTDLTLTDTRVEYRSWCLQNLQGSNQKSATVHVSLLADTPDAWRISTGGLSLTSPAHLQLSGLNATAHLNSRGVQCSGKFGLHLDAGADMPFNLNLKKAFSLSAAFTASLSTPHIWELSIKPEHPGYVKNNALQLQWQAYALDSAPPSYSLSARGNLLDGTGTAKATLQLPKVRITSEPTTIQSSGISVNATADWKKSFRNGSFVLNTQKVKARHPEGSLALPKTSISGNWQQNNGGSTGLTATLQFSGGQVSIPSYKTRAEGLKGQIPFQWPPPAKPSRQGSLSVSGIQRDKLSLGKISVSLQQTANEFTFRGIHDSSLFPQLSFNFSGYTNLWTAHAPQGSAHFEVFHPDSVDGIAVGKLFPGAQDMVLKGALRSDGDIVWTASGLNGDFRSTLTDGSVILHKRKIAVEGIRLAMSLPNLPEVRSAPRQALQFSKASFGALAVTDGRIEFQIESPQSILVEKNHFSWCDGTVDMQATRITPGEGNYDIVLFCDRLQLAKVLEQFGAASAEGGGTVTGRIPLRFEDGNVRFDDGFLFSAPGEGGKIHLRGTDMLTAGIPPETPQYVQMELAKEALKDYDYSWAKLNLTTEGEDLLLRLQLDGKPSNPLPFAYNKDLGGFAKVEAKSQGSVFQGIHLDVNFRLPLDKLLQIKDIFNPD